MRLDGSASVRIRGRFGHDSRLIIMFCYIWIHSLAAAYHLGCLDILDLEYSDVLYAVFKVRSAFDIKSAMGLSGLEPPTSRLSGVRSNLLSYNPMNPAPTCSPTSSPM